MRRRRHGVTRCSRLTDRDKQLLHPRDGLYGLWPTAILPSFPAPAITTTTLSASKSAAVATTTVATFS